MCMLSRSDSCWKEELKSVCCIFLSGNFQDDSSASDEWVEQTTDSSTLVSREKPLPAKQSHDDWSTNASIFAGVTREELQQSKEKKKGETDGKQYMLDTVSKHIKCFRIICLYCKRT